MMLWFFLIIIQDAFHTATLNHSSAAADASRASQAVPTCTADDAVENRPDEARNGTNF